MDQHLSELELPLDPLDQLLPAEGPGADAAREAVVVDDDDDRTRQTAAIITLCL